jgi:hypothetical protein
MLFKIYLVHCIHLRFCKHKHIISEMPHVGKGIRCQYTRENLEEAVSVVNSGMNVRNAAAHIDVPRSTLHDKVSSRVHVNATPGK